MPIGPIVTVVLPFAAATNPLVLKEAILAAMEGSYLAMNMLSIQAQQHYGKRMYL